MTKLQEMKKHLRPGQAYRREDLARWSNAVDRHLRQLVEDGTLKEAFRRPLLISCQHCIR